MKVISVANNKGGVGKSSCITQISGVLSYVGKRVLLIDGDSQHNMSSRLRLENSNYFLSDLLMGKCKIEDVLKQPYPEEEKLSNIWVIPSSFDLSTIDREYPDFNKKYAYILKESLKEIEDSFDVCIVDTNPSPALLTNMMAYCYSDYIIGVIDMCTDSPKGFQILLDTQIKPIQEVVNPNLKVLGIIFNNYDARSTYARTYLAQMQEIYGDLLFKSIITSSSIIPQSSAAMLPLIVFDPSSKLTTQFVELSAEILRKIKQGGANNV
jgi:chromosome partitioning protein